jgi:hypothetical protein
VAAQLAASQEGLSSVSKYVMLYVISLFMIYLIVLSIAHTIQSELLELLNE